MTGPVIDRGKTALKRTYLSRPVDTALDDGLLGQGDELFDYGCGRGDDLRLLNALGHKAAGWDPNHAPSSERKRADVVNLGFVVNVIDDPVERQETIKEAWRLAKRVLVVSARLIWDKSREPGRRHGDGVLTGAGTFQKYFEPQELRALVEAATRSTAYSAAPDILYVFRDPADAQKLLAHRSRRTHLPRQTVAQVLLDQHSADLRPLIDFVKVERRLPKPTEIDTSWQLITTFGSVSGAFAIVRRAVPDPTWAEIDLGQRRQRSQQLFATHFDILLPLITFLEDRGRPPRTKELGPDEAPLVKQFGSIRQAFALLRRTTPETHWSDATTYAKNNFLVYLAVAAFGGRPKFGELPEDLQHDAKDLFGSYGRACEEADKLLFRIADGDAIDEACRTAPFGKLTQSALYVHTCAVDRLDPLLRVYIGAATVLTGDVEDATLLKLHRLKAQVSFLVYPDFDSDPHPALEASVVARLGQVRMTHRYFGDSDNPPILHRKETFVPEDYPGHSKFRRLTAAEEKAGLLDRPDIGRRREWEFALANAAKQTRGHRLTSL